MAQILVRDLDPKVVDRLKARARINGRSLNSEVRSILESTAASSAVDRAAILERARTLLKGRTFSDSSVLIREDRER